MAHPSKLPELSVPLWVSLDEWDRAQASAIAAREGARLQEAQAALLGMESFFKQYPEVDVLEVIWTQEGGPIEALMPVLRGRDGEAPEGQHNGGALNDAHRQANSIGWAWKDSGGPWPPESIHKASFFAEIGPGLLGDEFFGAWMAERERRQLAKAVPRAGQAHGAKRSL